MKIQAENFCDDKIILGYSTTANTDEQLTLALFIHWLCTGPERIKDLPVIEFSSEIVID